MRKVKVLGVILQTFIVVVVIGNLQVKIYGQRNSCKEIQSDNPFTRNNRNSGTGVSNDVSSDVAENRFVPIQNETEKPIIYPKGTKPLIILSKSRPIRTEKSILNCVEGKVTLGATFYSNGKIGKFRVIKGLPFGLTKRTIEAAKKIKFEPEIKDFKKISIRTTIEYTFTLY
ncbi:MAG: energy transducer TonB [Pyrinomonadaceae bacterium]|nr:energy transducer TonB [Pyrinomonadaceae bacterium]